MSKEQLPVVIKKQKVFGLDSSEAPIPAKASISKDAAQSEPQTVFGKQFGITFDRIDNAKLTAVHTSDRTTLKPKSQGGGIDHETVPDS